MEVVTQHTFVPVQRHFKHRDGFDGWCVQAVGRGGYVGGDEGPFLYYRLDAAQDAADGFYERVVRQSVAIGSLYRVWASA